LQHITTLDTRTYIPDRSAITGIKIEGTTDISIDQQISKKKVVQKEIMIGMLGLEGTTCQEEY
jgi:hypothetical protein